MDLTKKKQVHNQQDRQAELDREGKIRKRRTHSTQTSNQQDKGIVRKTSSPIRSIFPYCEQLSVSRDILSTGPLSGCPSVPMVNCFISPQMRLQFHEIGKHGYSRCGIGKLKGDIIKLPGVLDKMKKESQVGLVFGRSPGLLKESLIP